MGCGERGEVCGERGQVCGERKGVVDTPWTQRQTPPRPRDKHPVDPKADTPLDPTPSVETVVRILLECILVMYLFSLSQKINRRWRSLEKIQDA